MSDFEIAESARYGAALTLGPVASYHHHNGRYQLQLSGHGFEANHFLSEDDLRELRDWINEALGGPSHTDYDAGLLNDFGGGNVEWWQDYLRAEIGRANDYWRSQLEAR